MNRTTDITSPDRNLEGQAKPDSNIAGNFNSLFPHKQGLPSRTIGNQVVPKQIMPIENTPGIYIIRCLVTGALYVGCAKYLRNRLFGHFNKLGRSDGENVLMQADWERYGPEGFDARFFHCSKEDMRWMETQLILFLRCRLEQGGYNRMVGGRWCLEARIRNIEWKLTRSRKLAPRHGVQRDVRMKETYARTFMTDSGLLSDEVEQIMADLVCPHLQQQLPAILAQLQTLPPADLRRPRREKRQQKLRITRRLKQTTLRKRGASFAVGLQ